MTQKTGALIFDETADRYDIRFDLIKEVSSCPFSYALIDCYQKKPLPANGLFWLHR